MATATSGLKLNIGQYITIDMYTAPGIISALLGVANALLVVLFVRDYSKSIHESFDDTISDEEVLQHLYTMKYSHRLIGAVTITVIKH